MAPTTSLNFKMINTKLHEHSKILETTIEGDITCDEMVGYIEDIMNNPDYPLKLKILTDATKANMVFGPDEIPRIIEAINKSLEKYDSITEALVVSRPNETALTIFFKLLSEKSTYSINAFATEKNAREWLYNKSLSIIR